MRSTLYEWFTGQLQFFDPQTGTSTHYNAATDTGGVALGELVFDTGVNGALVQPIRSPARFESGGQSNALEGIRFQTKSDPIVLRAGLIVRVIDGGNDSSLVGYTYQLEDSIASSLAWGRIMTATVMLATGNG